MKLRKRWSALLLALILSLSLSVPALAADTAPEEAAGAAAACAAQYGGAESVQYAVWHTGRSSSPAMWAITPGRRTGP